MPVLHTLTPYFILELAFINLSPLLFRPVGELFERQYSKQAMVPSRQPTQIDSLSSS